MVILFIYTIREKQNGKFEKAVISAPNGNEWFHVKIVIQYPDVSFYVNGNPGRCFRSRFWFQSRKIIKRNA
jgi:hypothetical protein